MNYKVFSSDQVVFEGSLEVSEKDSFSINITNPFSKPGKYYISLWATKPKTIHVKTMETIVIPRNETDPESIETTREVEVFEERIVPENYYSNTLKLQVNSKIKISHLKCLVTNSGTKDSKEV